jgi:uncharacterized protein (TIGR03435 family)
MATSPPAPATNVSEETPKEKIEVYAGAGFETGYLMIGKILAVGFVCAGAAFGQTATAPAAASTPAVANSAPTSTAIPAPAATAAASPSRAYAFDVISIRQIKVPFTRAMAAQDGPTPDGYRSHQPLVLLLLTAYVPQVGGAAFYNFQDQIKGLPDWLLSDGYDIDARIANEDRAEWQKPESQKVMLRGMLQALLAERCRLAVHRELKDSKVTTLVVAKDGPKFKETDPTAEHPGGQKLPFGGVMVLNKDGIHFYGASMASLASILSVMANQGPVQDKTGLTGLYDFTFAPPADDVDPGISPLAAMFLSGLNNLGLKLDSEKGQVETLVIDHMERPSEN